jgi:hypothetical protein
VVGSGFDAPPSMRGPAHIILGRLPECDVPIADKTVSGRHARLSWLEDGRILVEDLGSANGTFVGGARVSRAAIRVGDALALGSSTLSWSHPRVVAFLRGKAGGTVAMSAMPAKRPRMRGMVAVAVPLLALVAIAAALGFVLLEPEATQRAVAGAVEPVVRVAPPVRDEHPVGSPQEAAIRAHRLAGIITAIDSGSEATRNAAVQIASRSSGAFSLEQVAHLWSEVRSRWSYVNDPRGDEYFARASETIANGFAGDCDDFAITLAAFITAVGGEARIVVMESVKGGHAYAEACIPGTPEDVKRALVRHYRSRRASGGARRVRSVNYRMGASCGIWLNLDWNDSVPGGPYEPEHWAVGIYTDGRTETLAPAGAVTAEGAGDEPPVRSALPPSPAPR